MKKNKIWIFVLLVSSILMVNCIGKTKKIHSTSQISEGITQDTIGKKDNTPNGALKIIRKEINTVDDIAIVDTEFVKPIDYTNVISLKDLAIPLKKKKFIDLVLPGILIAKYNYSQMLKKAKVISKKETKTTEEQEYLDKLIKTYGANDVADLENRLLTHPTSIILAQASIESGWGTSRFFIQGSNIFGVWSFNENEPRIQTKGTRNGKHMYVKKYSTISESIDDYLKTLAKGAAYARFREKRASTNNPYEIIKTLDKYCELREAYVTKLKNQISFNDFEKYDTYKLDPQYISK